MLLNTVTEADLAFDATHIWHPYTSVIDRPDMFPVVGASGVHIELADGRQLLDGMASWWSAIHGYNHPRLNAAAHAQIDNMSHVMFGGLTHKPAIDVARKLIALTPEPLQTVFLADSGSVAVEVALKMAIQYWRSRGDKRRSRMLTTRGGYHGDTMGAMATCDPVNGMHGLFRGVLQQHIFAEKPACGFSDEWNESYIIDMETAIKEHHRDLVGVIIEPIVQGAGGMHFYSPHYLRRLRELCNQYDLLLILDEIATGFGRTGALFACEHAGVSPDIMCVGKALTGGYLTMAATLCTEEVSHTISANGVFMHGPTFMGNPLACSVAGASLDIIAQGGWKAQVAEISLGLQQGLEPCWNIAGVADVRVLGAIGVVEMEQPVDMKSLQPYIVEQGIWVRPFGRLIYIMPPYIMTPEQLAFLCQGIQRAVAKAGAKADGCSM